MGYCITQTGSDFRIPSDKVEDALHAALGHSPAGYVEDDWYMREDYFDELMAALRWEISVDEEGEITDDPGCVYEIYFAGEGLSNDLELLNLLAPHVEAGSYVQMQGEDGDLWRWVFDGKTCKQVAPTITWE